MNSYVEYMYESEEADWEGVFVVDADELPLAVTTEARLLGELGEFKMAIGELTAE